MVVNPKKLGTVRITAPVVHGEAPEWVRRLWFGLILECHPVLGYADEPMAERGVLSGQLAARKQSGVSVPQDKAIEALEAAGKITAAQWFRDHGFPRPEGCFFFRENEVEIVEGVVHQHFIQVTEEDRGDPFR